MTSSFGKIYLGDTLVSGGQSSTTTTGWVRPAAWPAIQTVLASEQKIVGLHAVWPGDGVGNGGNFFAFNGQGAYTIDFGDGTVTNYASNTQANYEFNFNNAALADTNRPVTFTASTSTINRTAHGLSAGDEIQFYNIAATAGINESRSYYVINPTANSFQVAATPGGTAVTLTNNGSATLLPYKVAIVTITPQAGQNLTVINLQAKHTQTGLQAYAAGWLDLAISVPNVAGANFTFGGTAVVHRLVERVNLVAYGALTTMVNMFNGCVSLQNIPAFPGSVAAVTSMSGMFNGCASLQSIPAFPGSVAAVTSMSQMFQGCSSLQNIPAFPGSVAAVMVMSQMFSGCASLQGIPVLNMAGISSAANGASFVATCPSFARAPVTGMRFSFSVASCKLSAVALNEIFTGLPTVTGQTITVTGNYGISQAGYDPTIATAKGWTVTA